MTAADSPRVVFSADGFTARPDIVADAEARAVALHRHGFLRMGTVRVRISRESPHIGPAHFLATVIAHGITGECVAHGSATEPIPAIDEAFRKLERALAAAHDKTIGMHHHPGSRRSPKP